MTKTKGICTARVLEEGRATIAAPVRQQLNLKQGDLVRLTIEPVGGDVND